MLEIFAGVVIEVVAGDVCWGRACSRCWEIAGVVVESFSGDFAGVVLDNVAEHMAYHAAAYLLRSWLKVLLGIFAGVVLELVAGDFAGVVLEIGAGDVCWGRAGDRC